MKSKYREIHRQEIILSLKRSVRRILESLFTSLLLASFSFALGLIKLIEFFTGSEKSPGWYISFLTISYVLYDIYRKLYSLYKNNGAILKWLNRYDHFSVLICSIALVFIGDELLFIVATFIIYFYLNYRFKAVNKAHANLYFIRVAREYFRYVDYHIKPNEYSRKTQSKRSQKKQNGKLMVLFLRIFQFSIYLVTVFSVLLFLLSTSLIAESFSNAIFGLASSLTIFVFTLYALNKVRKKISSIIEKDIESYIFKFASDHDGLLTATLLASDGKISYKESIICLNKLEEKGACHKMASIGSTSYKYKFHDLASN